MGSVCESCSPTGRGKAIGGASVSRMTTAVSERQLFPQRSYEFSSFRETTWFRVETFPRRKRGTGIVTTRVRVNRRASG